MKKTAAFVALLLCMSLAACSGQSKKDAAIEEINGNCDVPFALTLPETELQNTDGYVKMQGFGGYLLENDDLSFTIGGYPDVLDEYHVTGYQIKSAKYTLMGLQTGCPLDEADKAMKEKGFTISTEDNRWSRYEKSGVRIGVELNGDAVAVFHVSVEVTNKQKVVF